MIDIPSILQTRHDLDSILIQAVAENASDIHISSELRLSIRQHGVIKPVTTRRISKNETSSLLVAARDENPSCLGIINSGEDLNFSYVCKPSAQNGLLRFRVNASSKHVAGKKGIALVFRVLDTSPPDAGTLGIEPEIIECMGTMTKGLAIVTGPTGSGKSTLLAAINRRRLETRAEIMITHEAPIEFVYDGIATDSVVNQREIGSSGDYRNFYEALVGSLRQDPDIILVGEARDRETITAALHGVQTGHALFTTMHTQGVAHTISRCVKEFATREREARLMDLIDALAIIIYQNLVPAAEGGRVALREYLIFDGETRKKLRECPLHRLSATINSLLLQKGQSLLTDAYNKLQAKIITIDTYSSVEKHFNSMNAVMPG